MALNATDDEIRLVARFAVEVAHKHALAVANHWPKVVVAGFEHQGQIVQILIRHLSPEQEKVYLAVTLNPATLEDMMRRPEQEN